jgi:hypothetical protein
MADTEGDAPSLAVKPEHFSKVPRQADMRLVSKMVATGRFGLPNPSGLSGYAVPVRNEGTRPLN